MRNEPPAALDKLYSMLQDADSLGLSRPARMRLVGVIGSLENEELERVRTSFPPGIDDDAAPSSARAQSSRHM